MIDASQLKSRFLANMSHELRTPLNSIIGYTGILSQEIVGELNDEQKRQLKMVSESGHNLLELINDILDLSKIEAGKIEIIPAQFDVRELVRMVEKMVLPLVEEKGLTIHVLIAEDVPPVVYNDKSRIKQVLDQSAFQCDEVYRIRRNHPDCGLRIAECGIFEFGIRNSDFRFKRRG